MPSDSATALVSLSRHTLRQLKFVLPGGLITYYLNSHVAFWRIATGEADSDGWAQVTALAALFSAAITVVLTALATIGRAVISDSDPDRFDRSRLVITIIHTS
ncbi:hypothetical protein A0H81_07861 [Grifola frondosa]|uniref:Uncharacterized protein n=1 Tax=Grifola frondosa TaxID=5627 RepID=A0A1C7M6R1_GRIFR|nr:hypothetical protein A0H81_07861 [Grifola frondosa]